MNSYTTSAQQVSKFSKHKTFSRYIMSNVAVRAEGEVFCVPFCQPCFYIVGGEFTYLLLSTVPSFPSKLHSFWGYKKWAVDHIRCVAFQPYKLVCHCPRWLLTGGEWKRQGCRGRFCCGWSKCAKLCTSRTWANDFSNKRGWRYDMVREKVSGSWVGIDLSEIHLKHEKCNYPKESKKREVLKRQAVYWKADH